MATQRQIQANRSHKLASFLTVGAGTAHRSTGLRTLPADQEQRVDSLPGTAFPPYCVCAVCVCIAGSPRLARSRMSHRLTPASAVAMAPPISSGVVSATK